MLDFLISALIAAALSVLGVVYLKKYFSEHDAAVSVKHFRILLVSTAAVAVILTLLVNFSVSGDGGTSLDIIKRSTLITGLLLCAIPDLKLHLIPNKIILCLAVLWLAESAVSWFVEPIDIVSDIISSAIGAALGGGLLFIGRLISRNGMGMGDIKLMLVAGLYAKFDGMFGLLFWSLLLALITGLVLIAFKKVKMKTTISMAPFFLIGAVVVDAVILFS